MRQVLIQVLIQGQVGISFLILSHRNIHHASEVLRAMNRRVSSAAVGAQADADLQAHDGSLIHILSREKVRGQSGFL